MFNKCDRIDQWAFKKKNKATSETVKGKTAQMTQHPVI